MNILVSPILENKGNLGYFLILPSQLINTWFALKCKNITLHTLLIIRKYCFEVSLFLSYYPWQMFAREKLRGHFLASILAENGNHCATEYSSNLWSHQEIAVTYLPHIFLRARSSPPQAWPLKTRVNFTSVFLWHQLIKTDYVSKKCARPDKWGSWLNCSVN